MDHATIKARRGLLNRLASRHQHDDDLNITVFFCFSRFFDLDRRYQRLLDRNRRRFFRFDGSHLLPVKIRMFRCQALIMPVGTTDLYRITQLSSSRKNHAILKTSARLSRRADVSYSSIYLFRKAPIFSASFMPLSYIICSFSWLLLSVDRPQISSGATMSSLPSF